MMFIVVITHRSIVSTSGRST